MIPSKENWNWRDKWTRAEWFRNECDIMLQRVIVMRLKRCSSFVLPLILFSIQHNSAKEKTQLHQTQNDPSCHEMKEIRENEPQEVLVANKALLLEPVFCYIFLFNFFKWVTTRFCPITKFFPESKSVLLLCCKWIGDRADAWVTLSIICGQAKC